MAKLRLRLLILTLSAGVLACSLPGLAGSAATPTATATPTPAATRTPTLTPTPTATSTPVPPTATPTPPDVQALPDPSGYQWREVAGGFSQPLAVAHAGDDRLFVVEQRGMIWVVQNDLRLPDPFLDIRDRVFDAAFEQGLLGLAFHPDYPSNGAFFVNYTGVGGNTVVSRFSTSLEGGQADPASEQVLLRIDQPYGNHNGGNLAFGPDGYLYIGTGDGGSANDPLGNGQNLNTLLGKLLRIDVDGGNPYAIPPDNPFAGGGGAPEIWAYGLRNPWRFSFDRLNGDLYIGDVGQNNWEEVDYLPAGAPAGANFGWKLREGTHPFAGQQTEGLVDPIAEYANAGRNCSVTGGIVVRASQLPEWNGVYLYGDYCSGQVWGLTREAGGAWLGAVLFSTGLTISSFGEGADGSAYLVHHGGAVYRLEAAP